jgi:hypothetical protein
MNLRTVGGKAASCRGRTLRDCRGCWTRQRRDAATISGAGRNRTPPREGRYTCSGAEPADHAIRRSRGGLMTKIRTLADGRERLRVVRLAPAYAVDVGTGRVRWRFATGTPSARPQW